MAKKGFIAIGLPPPDKAKAKEGGSYEGDELDSQAEADDEEADKAAGVSAAADFAKAMKGGDPEAIYDAFKDLMEHC